TRTERAADVRRNGGTGGDRVYREQHDSGLLRRSLCVPFLDLETGRIDTGGLAQLRRQPVVRTADASRLGHLHAPARSSRLAYRLDHDHVNQSITHERRTSMIRQYVIAVTLGICAAAALFGGASLRAGHQQPVSGVPPSVSNSGGRTETRLPDGRLLWAGGQGSSGLESGLSVFDPRTRTTVRLNARLQEARPGHTGKIS